MQKVKDILHVGKDKDARTDHYTPSGGHGTSERVIGGGSSGTGLTGSHTGQTGARTGENVTGVGAGATHGAAKHAADEAARKDRDVHVDTKSGVATGRPVANPSQVTGVGAGHDHASAKQAANQAASQNRDVNVQTGSGTATGKPVGHSGSTVDKAATAATGAHTHAAGDVIDRKYYTGTEHRPQDQKLVEQFREHNPYAKDYETTVQHTGRERLINSEVEALGTNERVVGQDNLVGNPHHEIHRNLPKGAVNERPGGEGWVQGKPGPVCDSTEFSVGGDRPVVKERVTDLKQHNQFEKEFEVATHFKGERATGGATQPELLNRERVLVDEKKKIPCEGHPKV